MARARRSPPVFHAYRPVPFASATEGWFWAMACLEARHEGARIVAGLGEAPRPCEPDDLIVQLGRLRRAGRLGTRHLEVLALYGRRGSAPDAGRPAEAHDERLWREALAALLLPLKARGIVA